ncbi:pyridoxine 5'-phosphate synthase [bacterium]|nr:pyridoxine 5'-phosphate synthase [bacterium]
MTRLSVNINKIATLRNARGGNIPSVVEAAVKIQNFGAEGITIHPRPDERHITRKDVYALKPVVHTEFNIEGYPSSDFLKLIEEIRPEQVTLVPDGPDVLTSNAGWDCITHQQKLKEIVSTIQSWGLRVSLFLDPNPEMVSAAADTGTNRIELYTEAYASGYGENAEQAISSYLETAIKAKNLGLGVNAGHDLNLKNLRYFVEQIPFVEEVSIGHALVSDALDYGMNNTIQMYLEQLNRASYGF